jgi:hypothetical protein
VTQKNRLNKAFRIIAFDWDGTAVKDRAADARPLALRLEQLMELAVQLVVITGTNFDNINHQFCRLVNGRYKINLHVLTNRGSEVFGFDEQSRPVLLYRREATARENELLTRVAEGVRDWARERGGPEIAIVYDRLNRRKIDLIPEPEWADPPKSRIGELLVATERRLKDGGIRGGIHELFMLTERLARDYGLTGAKITTDVKHIEVGLTDKGDSTAWVANTLAPRVGAHASDILVAGDEFGPIGGFAGSDDKMVIPELKDAVYVSVGAEPDGVPGNVIHLSGGPARFLELMDEQIALCKAMR